MPKQLLASAGCITMLAAANAGINNLPGISPDGPSCPDPGDSPHRHMLRRGRRLQQLGRCHDLDSVPSIPESKRNPIYLVPPMLGSQIDVKVDNPPGMPFPVCDMQEDWKQMWFPVGGQPNCDSHENISCLPPDIYPLYADCWGFKMSLEYNDEDGTSSDPAGISTRLHNGIQEVCGIGLDCVCQQLSAMGWEFNATSTAPSEVAGHTYDWRQGPVDWSLPGGYYSQAKASIEALVASTGKKVLAISFSLGGPVFSTFLSTYVDEAWKETNIAGWLSYSGTLGGVQQSMAIQVGTGSIFPIPTMTSYTGLNTYRSWQSQTWMAAALPRNRVLVNVSDGRGGTTASYTGAELQQLFRDAGFADNAGRITKANRYLPTVPPNVESFIVYGLGHPTPQTYEFGVSSWTGWTDWTSTPQVYCGDGDSVADQDSVEGVPQRWALAQQKPVHTYNIGKGGPYGPNATAGHDDSPRTVEGLQILIDTVQALGGR